MSKKIAKVNEVKAVAAAPAKRIIIREALAKEIKERIQVQIKSCEDIKVKDLLVPVITSEMISEISKEGYQNYLMDFMLFNKAKVEEVADQLIKNGFFEDKVDENGKVVTTKETLALGRVKRHEKDYLHMIPVRAKVMIPIIKRVKESSTKDQLAKRFA